ncbi:unnamed protein product [Acanthoscelides obtectus]|uniref:Uncharacterized protein n=1 Tax=Acanthoscelides obtectus TaxID=200917 RepID=A0A9P0LQX6_ACAOB|nr:unnamed protein product [Acanthoscelides obtectus]CAK1683247.1 hypothetical protein AOBTE_LOCUS34163 [Acanthoscelides obtectus]
MPRRSISKSRSRSRSGASHSSSRRNRRERESRSPMRPIHVRALPVQHEEQLSPSLQLMNTTLPRAEANTDNMDCGDDTLILHNDVTLPEDILKLMGKDVNTDQSAVFSLHDQLTTIWQTNLTNGLKKSDAQTLFNAYQTSEKLSFLRPPELNPEVKAALSKQNISVDASYVEMQNQLGKGLAALGRSISTIFLDLEHMPDQFKGDFLTSLCDSGRILTNLFHRMSVTRKNLLVPGLKISKELADDCLPGEFLFGSNLTQK